MLFLTEDQVRKVLTYHDLIPAIRQALIDFSARRLTQPVRTVLPVNQFSGWFAVMPAVCGAVMGAKMVTFYPNNTALNKHTHLATIQLFRADTGEPLAIMDGRLITEMRTAAVSAVAIHHLAAPNANILAILGSGVQARSHFKALSYLRSFADVRVWSRSSENARRFATEIGACATTAEDAARNADVVLTLTSSAQPVLQSTWLKSDAIVCAIGAVTPDRRELDDDCMRGSIIVESREAALRESGDIIQTNALIDAEIGELLNGATFPKKPGPVVFKSVGIAVEDIASAKLVYDKVVAA
jgi:thiomorpholine-carboxylate dehydrogenase